ncbi:MAG: YheT family hydrolase [Pseudomonadota bacterium]
MEFRPHPLLRSPHVQTLLSSRLLRGTAGTAASPAAGGGAGTGVEILPCRDGVRLQALVDAQPEPAPLVVMIHGWLGGPDSPYMRRASTALHAAGFSVARLTLRDHGGTAQLNEGLFNAARIGEVVDAVNVLVERHGGAGCGLLGYSLGGNFVLRLAAHAETSARVTTALAVCPVLDPEAAVTALDRGWIGYQRYFLRKWRQAFAEKEAAFPELYDFSTARRLSLVTTLTDYFVPRHTPYRHAGEYYSHYTLTRSFFQRLRIPARILATEDDPVVPVAHARALLGGAGELTLVPYGGHCGFIEDFRLTSALERYLERFFARHCGRHCGA